MRKGRVGPTGAAAGAAAALALTMLLLGVGADVFVAVAGTDVPMVTSETRSAASIDEGGSTGRQLTTTIVVAGGGPPRRRQRKRLRRALLDASPASTASSPFETSQTPSSSSSSSQESSSNWARRFFDWIAAWSTANGSGGGSSRDQLNGTSTSNATMPVDGRPDGWDEASNNTADSADWGIPLEPSVLKDRGKVANVVGGYDAGPFEAPFFVMFMSWSDINHQWEFTGCGGTLVSDRHVLTAGHCAMGRDARLDAAYVHAYRPFDGNPGVPFHYSKVLSYQIHPDFDDGPNSNDVAIATLHKPVDPATFRPIRLAAPPSAIQLRDGDETKVYGFGRQNFRSKVQVKTLQVVDVPFLTRESCRQSYGARVLDDMVCTAAHNRDACSGDSGGPLVAVREGVTYQVAVVSWGRGCGSEAQPGVYASTLYHYVWIRDRVCGGPSVKSPLCSESSYGSSPASDFRKKKKEQDAAPSGGEGPVRDRSRAGRRKCRRRRNAGLSCARSEQCCSRKCRATPAGRVCVEA
jgi:Trypsin